MKVIDFILDVAKSDLKQITLNDVGTGTASDTVLQKDNMAAMLSFVNQGIVKLHTKFPLLVNIVEFDTDTYDTSEEGIVELGTVKLPSNALSLLNIVTDTYDKVPLDDKGIEFLFKQNTYKKLFVSTVAINTYVISGYNEDNVKTLYFEHTAVPAEVKLTSDIPLPVKFLEALRYFVSYKGYSTIKSTTPTGDVNVTYKKLFDDACSLLENTTDMLTDDNSFDADKLWKKNFV